MINVTRPLPVLSDAVGPSISVQSRSWSQVASGVIDATSPAFSALSSRTTSPGASMPPTEKYVK